MILVLQYLEFSLAQLAYGLSLTGGLGARDERGGEGIVMAMSYDMDTILIG
jgi:hypothetical protein